MRTWWTPRNSDSGMVAREGSGLVGYTRRRRRLVAGAGSRSGLWWRSGGEGAGAGGVADVDGGGAPAAPIAGELFARVGAEGEADALAGVGGEVGFDGDPAAVEGLGAGVDRGVNQCGGADEELEADSIAKGGLPHLRVEGEGGLEPDLLVGRDSRECDFDRRLGGRV